ncbi:ABC transporter substrate-binding protein [Nesterenkonia alba]|uniref:ABC transporter substrate-binding protein n=1 Tax=Nesterenkonia alba TaxID=515814 RepID=UPI0003B3899A|nr:ABC transporter substrate-binding protein [Nesterenkonia alba]
MRSTRTVMKGAALVSMLALGLTACGGNGNGENDNDAGGEQEEVQLRFTWWGGEERHQATEEIIELFEAEHPHISVSGEYGDWDGYWDQLATQAAAGDLPDVVQMELRYMREYFDNEQFIPLEDVDVSSIPESVLEGGMIEGDLYGVPTGSTVASIIANRDVFDEAGVEFPDDSTWTWDDFREITQQISDNSEAYGMSRPFGDFGFEVWLRQHAGKDIVTDDGDLDLEPEDAVPYFDMLLEMTESGAMPPAAQAAEERGIAQEQSMVLTDQAAMHVEWYTGASGAGTEEVDVLPIRFPTLTGNAEDGELFYKPAMFYSVASGSDHPEEAQLFVDFMMNSEEVAAINGHDRGVPANVDLQEAAAAELDEDEQLIAEFHSSLEDEVSDNPPIPPEGFGSVQGIIFRYEEEVIFERLSSEEAAEQMVAEIEAAIS